MTDYVFKPKCSDCHLEEVETPRSKRCKACRLRVLAQRQARFRQRHPNTQTPQAKPEALTWDAIKLMVNLGQCPTCGRPRLTSPTQPAPGGQTK